MIFDANQIIFETVWAALPQYKPDERKRILQALLVKINAKHPAYKNICAQLALLDTLEGLQNKLPFSDPRTPPHDHHHDGGPK